MPSFSIRKLCRLLGVNRQWYYQHRCPSAHQEYDQRLCAAIKEIREAEAFYGYRRVTKALIRSGGIGQSQAGLACHATRWFDLQAQATHGAYNRFETQPTWVYPNLVKGLQVEAPNRCWVSDLTYVRLPEGFVYLACILDLYSRKCIGWSLSRRIDAQLPLQALEMALTQRQVAAGLIHHSDRGRQYCSKVYVERLLDVEANISMSIPGQPTENAFAESFFKTLKWEEVYLHKYQTFEEAAAAPADVSGGCLQCQTSALIVRLRASR
jgi:putative transposase